MAEWVSHLIVADSVLERLPAGAIPAKVKMMYYLPALEEGKYPFVGFSREEYAGFLERAVEQAVHAIEDASGIIKERIHN